MKFRKITILTIDNNLYLIIQDRLHEQIVYFENQTNLVSGQAFETDYSLFSLYRGTLILSGSLTPMERMAGALLPSTLAAT